MAGKAKALETRKVDGADYQIGVYTLVNPVNLNKFRAEYAEATSLAGAGDAAQANGLSLLQLNEAMRGIVRETYIEALGKTVDDRISGFIKSAKDMGMSEEDITNLVEGHKAKLGDTLPKGLMQVKNPDGTPTLAKRKGRAPGAKLAEKNGATTPATA